MSFVMLTCTVGLLSGGWDLGWHQYTTSSHATTLESNKSVTIYDILGRSDKEAPRMAHVHFTDVQDRPTEFLDLTSLTLAESHQLLPPFEAAFQAQMAAWRL